MVDTGEADIALLHQVVHGGPTVTVTTEGGPVDSAAKVIADMRAELEGEVADLNAAVLAAANSAATATTQAGIATTKAGESAASAAAALAAQLAAEAAATNAATYRDSALAYRNTAGTHASDASGFADVATNQAGISTTQAGISSAQATVATTKAGEAVVSAAAADASATTALGYKNTTYTYMGAASGSAAAALASQTAAAASETNAAASTDEATTAASDATTQAGISTAQATTATTQAGISTTKAGESSASAAAALVSQNAAAASAGAALGSQNAANASATAAANSAASIGLNPTFNSITSQAATNLVLTANNGAGHSLILGKGGAGQGSALGTVFGTTYFMVNGSYTGTSSSVIGLNVDPTLTPGTATATGTIMSIAGTYNAPTGVASNVVGLRITAPAIQPGGGGSVTAGYTVLINGAPTGPTTVWSFYIAGGRMYSGDATDVTYGTLASGGIQTAGGASFTKGLNVGGRIFSGITTYGTSASVSSVVSAFHVPGVSAGTEEIMSFGNSSNTGLFRGYQDGGGTIMYEFGGIQNAGTFKEYVRVTGSTSGLTSGDFHVYMTTASSNTSTGSLINAGGFGNAGKAYIGGDVNLTGGASGNINMYNGSRIANANSGGNINFVAGGAVFIQGSAVSGTVPQSGGSMQFNIDEVFLAGLKWTYGGRNGGWAAPAWGTTGVASHFFAGTWTDNSTAGSGTATTAVFNSFAIPTLAATNTLVTTTDAATVYIAGGPANGTNNTITNSWGLWNAGKTKLGDVTDITFGTLASGGLQTAGGASFTKGLQSGGQIMGNVTVDSSTARVSGTNAAFTVGVTSTNTRDVLAFGDTSRVGLLRGFQNGGNNAYWEFGGYINAGAFVEHIRFETVVNSLTSGALKVFMTTGATNSSTGAFICSGGGSFAEKLYVASGVFTNTITAISGSLTLASGSNNTVSITCSATSRTRTTFDNSSSFSDFTMDVLGSAGAPAGSFLFSSSNGTVPVWQVTQNSPNISFLGKASVVKGFNTAVVAVSALDIDWALGNDFTKTLGANSTFTFSNLTEGQTINVTLTNTASNYTVTWPTVSWSGGVAPVQTVGAKSDVYTFKRVNGVTYGNVIQNF